MPAWWRVSNQKLKNRVNVRFMTKVFWSILSKVRNWQPLLQALPWRKTKSDSNKGSQKGASDSSGRFWFDVFDIRHCGIYQRLSCRTTSSLMTCFTPLTFLVSCSARFFPLEVSTDPLKVTTPSLTITSKAPPLTSASVVSYILTRSYILSSGLPTF
jgi:hypothetical protein